jgi:hypothetical protein
MIKTRPRQHLSDIGLILGVLRYVITIATPGADSAAVVSRTLMPSLAIEATQFLEKACFLK